MAMSCKGEKLLSQENVTTTHFLYLLRNSLLGCAWLISLNVIFCLVLLAAGNDRIYSLCVNNPLHICHYIYIFKNPFSHQKDN